jgi:hypothetical protein
LHAPQKWESFKAVFKICLSDEIPGQARNEEGIFNLSFELNDKRVINWQWSEVIVNFSRTVIIV